MPQLEEESLRDNFVIAYELLDEVMDFGYPQVRPAALAGVRAASRAEAAAKRAARRPACRPRPPARLQFTEAKILSEYIKTDAHKMAVQARPPMAVTNAVSWRTEGLVYKKNEVFLDVVESVNLLVNSNGSVVRSEVVGTLKMRAYLSGMVSARAGRARTRRAGARRSPRHAQRGLGACLADSPSGCDRRLACPTVCAAQPEAKIGLNDKVGHPGAALWAWPGLAECGQRAGRCTPAHQPCAASAASTGTAPSPPRPAPPPPARCLPQVLFEAQGRLGRQKAVDLEDIKFHQCVRLASFERDRTISFIPPDGAFELMCGTRRRRPRCRCCSATCPAGWAWARKRAARLPGKASASLRARPPASPHPRLPCPRPLRAQELPLEPEREAADLGGVPGGEA